MIIRTFLKLREDKSPALPYRQCGAVEELEVFKVAVIL